MYNLSLVLVVLLFSSDIGNEHAIIETTRRGGSFRYWRCRCRTLLYLPCIFRLRTETIWFSATLRILICGDPSLETLSGSQPISFAREIYIYIYIYVTYRGVEICFVSKIVSISPCFFSYLHKPNLRSPRYAMIIKSVHDWSLAIRCILHRSHGNCLFC